VFCKRKGGISQKKKAQKEISIFRLFKMNYSFLGKCACFSKSAKA
jgi:hypothetical protein